MDLRSQETKKLKIINNGEFDPGSGLTLAAGLIHASRTVTGDSNIMLTSGARVRNTYATYPLLGHNLEKSGLILHVIMNRHLLIIKVTMVKDGHASH